MESHMSLFARISKTTCLDVSEKDKYNKYRFIETKMRIYDELR